MVASSRHDVRGSGVWEVVQAVDKGHNGGGGRRASFLTDEFNGSQDVIKLVTDAKRGLKRNVVHDIPPITTVLPEVAKLQFINELPEWGSRNGRPLAGHIAERWRQP